MRIFIVIFGLIISTQVIASSPNRFESITAEFSVVKPDEWQFATAEQNLENLKRMEMNDKDFHKAMVKYATTPLVVIMKYPEPFDDLNPSFKVNIKPLGRLKGADPKKILKLFLPKISKMFEDFELIQAPKDTKVSGNDAAYMRINYSMKIQDGRVFPTTSEMWIVPRGQEQGKMKKPIQELK
ncbi:MAG: hypothetical protein COA86_04570 [Kangiella sp.]|nr:MAG: hypothetical protein COA86_04570 [Kangiella sp.]